MKELKVLNHDGTLVVDSREVAEMVGKNHKELLRDIRGYIEILEKSNERKIAPVAETLATQQSAKLRSANFFLESSYKADDGSRSYPCYLLTKQFA